MKPCVARNLTLAVCLLMAFALQSSAIEGLKLTVVCPHVVLSWPSVEEETDIVQWREDLSTDSTWVTLTNALPAFAGTNLTVFVHTNRVDCPMGQIFGVMLSGSGGNASLSSQSEEKDFTPTGPVVVPKDGSKAPVPLLIYPPGFDLSGRIILWPDGSTDEWSKELVEKWRANRETELEGPEPEDAGGDPGTGFYRVVRNGVHLVGVTNNPVLEGVVEIPIELGATNENVPGIRLYADGIALPMCTVTIPTSGYPVARWNTSFLQNGTYQLHAECDFLGSAEVLVSTTNSVTVSNSITFDEFSTLFGEQMWLKAQLTITDADFEIDMFAEGGYVGTFGGSTTDGSISFAWDLTDPSGQTLTNTAFEGVFYAAAAGGNPRTNKPARRQWFKDYGLSGDGFVIAWAVTKVSPLPSRIETLMLDGVINILASPGADPYQLSPENSYNGTAFRLTSATRTNLMSYLADSSHRNFYFFGHGNSSSFGDYNELQGWLVSITDLDVRIALTNFFPLGTNLHAYRFVFLDSCKSANGSLPDSFGIPKHQLHRAYCRNVWRVAPRAFVGYLETDIKLPKTATEHTYNSDMLGQFFAEWRDGAELHGIVARAKQNQYWPLDPSVITWGATNLYRYY